MSNTLVKTVKKRYMDGESINAISKDLRKAKRTISNILKDQGVHIAAVREFTPHHQRRAQNIFDMYLAGQTQTAIGDFYGLTQERICHILTRYFKDHGLVKENVNNLRRFNRLTTIYQKNPTYMNFYRLSKQAEIVGKKVKKVG